MMPWLRLPGLGMPGCDHAVRLGLPGLWMPGCDHAVRLRRGSACRGSGCRAVIMPCGYAVARLAGARDARLQSCHAAQLAGALDAGL